MTLLWGSSLPILHSKFPLAAQYYSQPMGSWDRNRVVGSWGKGQAPRKVHHKSKCKLTIYTFQKTFNQVNKTCLNTLLLIHKYWFIYNNPRQFYLQKHHPKLQVKYISGIAWVLFIYFWRLVFNHFFLQVYIIRTAPRTLLQACLYQQQIHFQARGLSATLGMVSSLKSSGTVLSSGRSWLTCDFHCFK